MLMLKELEDLASKMDTLSEQKKEILVNSLLTLSAKLIDNISALTTVLGEYNSRIHPSVMSQIQAAEKRTEIAADDIMTATESIMSAMGNVNGSGKTDIQNAVNDLFQACNFQDLVAQHLKEIKILHDEMGEDMRELKDNLAAVSKGGKGNTIKPRQKRPDAHLLNGPSTTVVTR